jgi:hypothetical protein
MMRNDFEIKGIVVGVKIEELWCDEVFSSSKI